MKTKGVATRKGEKKNSFLKGEKRTKRKRGDFVLFAERVKER